MFVWNIFLLDWNRNKRATVLLCLLCDFWKLGTERPWVKGGGVPIVLALSVLNWNLQSDTLYHSEKWLSISQGPGTTDALWTRCGCFYDLGPFSLPGFNTGILSKAWRSEQHWSNIEIDQEADHVEYYKVNGCFEGY